MDSTEKEKDDEAKGAGNEYDYGMRIYDPRLGRFMSVDPITDKYPELTPYASNKPIRAIDLDGLEAQDYDMGGMFLNEVGNMFVAAGQWFDETFSFSSPNESSQTVSKKQIGQVTNETSIKLKTNTTTTTHLGDKLRYLQLHNTSNGDPTPVASTEKNAVVETENKTSIKVKTSKGTMTMYNATAVDNNGKVTNTTGVNTESVIRGVPVVTKSSTSTSSDGTTSSSNKAALGTSNVNVGIVLKTSSNSSGTTTSIGVSGETSGGGTSVKQDLQIDVKTKK